LRAEELRAEELRAEELRAEGIARRRNCAAVRTCGACGAYANSSSSDASSVSASQSAAPSSNNLASRCTCTDSSGSGSACAHGGAGSAPGRGASGGGAPAAGGVASFEAFAASRPPAAGLAAAVAVPASTHSRRCVVSFESFSKDARRKASWVRRTKRPRTEEGSSCIGRPVASEVYISVADPSFGRTRSPSDDISAHTSSGSSVARNFSANAASSSRLPSEATASDSSRSPGSTADVGTPAPLPLTSSISMIARCWRMPSDRSSSVA
jgi:hypothetical protein